MAFDTRSSPLLSGVRKDLTVTGATIRPSVSESKSPVRIAVLQDASVLGDVDANVGTIRRAASAAVTAGAELLVTPEMFVTGYNVGSGLARLASAPLLEMVSELATTAGIAIAAGLPLVRSTGITNSAVLVSAAGELLASYDKTHLFGDLDRSMFVAGSSLSRLVKWNGLWVGLLICYDVEFPETVRFLATHGADLVLVPTAQMQPFEFVAEHVVPSRAWENQVYVAYANHIGSERELKYVGRSIVAAPDASSSNIASPDAPALLVADIDPAVLARSRVANPYLLDRRPELYGSSHDEDVNPVNPSNTDDLKWRFH